MGVGAIGGLFVLFGLFLIGIAILFYLLGASGKGYISIEKGRVSGGGTFVVVLFTGGIALVIIGGAMMALPGWLPDFTP